MATATATADGFRTVRLLGDRGPQIRLSPYWVHPPSPRQAVFLSLPHMEAMYGGAGGGGKTDALLAAALQYVDVPGYSALLLRRTYRQLTRPGQLLDLAKRWLRGSDAKWNETESKFVFPSTATITFGHLDSDRDLEDYSGPSYQFIGFDELTQFPERHYTFLFTRLRRTEDVQVPVRMRAATNPGGAGHQWVKDRFVDELRDPGRMFVPAKVRDNPALDVDLYIEAMGQLDEQTRQQILDGDWNAREPGDWVYDKHGIDAAERLGTEYDGRLAAGTMFEPADGEVVLGIDWGIGETHALVGWPLAGGGIYIPPGEVVASRGEPSALTRRMLEAAAVYDFPLGEARYDAAGAQQMETFAANSPAEVGIWAVAFSKRKAKTIGYLRRLFERTAQGHHHQVVAISPANKSLLAQLRGLKFKDPHTERIEKENDHGPDALVALASPIANRYAEEVIGSAS